MNRVKNVVRGMKYFDGTDWGFFSVIGVVILFAVSFSVAGLVAGYWLCLIPLAIFGIGGTYALFRASEFAVKINKQIREIDERIAAREARWEREW